MEHNKRGWPWPGTWKVVCDVCGQYYPSDKVKKRWDGFMVCHNDWEERHPQTLYRYKTHISVPNFIRPDPDEGRQLPVCDAFSIQPRAGFAVAGCAIVGIVYNIDEDTFRGISLPAIAIAGIAIAGKI